MIAIVIYFSLSVGLLVAAGQVEPMPWGLVLILLAVILASAGLSEFVAWVRLTDAEVRKRNKLAERRPDIEYLAATERVMHLALKATPEQDRTIQALNAVIISNLSS